MMSPQRVITQSLTLSVSSLSLIYSRRNLFKPAFQLCRMDWQINNRLQEKFKHWNHVRVIHYFLIFAQNK